MKAQYKPSLWLGVGLLLLVLLSLATGRSGFILPSVLHDGDARALNWHA